MDCPRCHQPMSEGWLALFNPIAWLTFVCWQPERPGYVRMLAPRDGEKVIVPRVGGRGCPRAQLCRGCKTVVFRYSEDELN